MKEYMIESKEKKGMTLVVPDGIVYKKKEKVEDEVVE